MWYYGTKRECLTCESAGAKGPPGKQGEQGDPGDEVKSELQVHLNALKGYVDMKFDVLKGMPCNSVC